MSPAEKPKRLLVTLAHYFDDAGNGYYGSTGANAEPRVNGLSATIAAVHQLFGMQQSKLLNRKHRIFADVNEGQRYEIDLVVCTTAGKSLLDRLELPAGWFEERASSVEGLLLPFECHAVLRERLGDYDYYCYMEDDLVVQDPLFFAKLDWFNQQVGSDALLLPNRFELSVKESLAKLYIDGHVSPDFAAKWQNVKDRQSLVGRALGREITFERPNNPHAGCFFLNRDQMSRWVEQPHFLDRDTAFAGPLESAATLGIMKTFRIYKPAPVSSGFLEIWHANNRYLGNWLNK
jgi:hypothetical protein